MLTCAGAIGTFTLTGFMAGLTILFTDVTAGAIGLAVVVTITGFATQKKNTNKISTSVWSKTN